MIWISNKDKYDNMRGNIETYEQFVKRNVGWWHEERRFERRRRRKYYEQFIEYCGLGNIFSLTRNIAEVGPGAFGGILQVCKVPANRKYFIDYIMRELVNLKFISWPNIATYVDAPAEDIPLADDTVDILLSYNCLDHGWDIWSAISECIRISQRCYLCFDCRGDSEEEIKIRTEKKDLDHKQTVKYTDVLEFMKRYKKYQIKVTDLGTKDEWHVAVIQVEK